MIAPGLAFEPRGRVICVDARFRLALPATFAALLVQLTCREPPCGGTIASASAPV